MIKILDTHKLIYSGHSIEIREIEYKNGTYGFDLTVECGDGYNEDEIVFDCESRSDATELFEAIKKYAK